MKTTHSLQYKFFTDWLIAQRKLIGYTQQQLSSILNKPQSFVSKYENGERRLDITEAIEICKAIQKDPHEMIDVLLKGKI